MDAPSMLPQCHCALPFCGKAPGGATKVRIVNGERLEYPEFIDAHHVYGKHIGPVWYICHECHMGHHFGDPDTMRLTPVYDADLGKWYVRRSDGKAGWLVVYNEHADPIPFDDALPDATDFLDALSVQRYSDWLLSREVVDLSRAYGGETEEFRDFIIDACDLSPKSAGAWIRNRIAYGALQGEGVEYIGITRGVQVARLVATGHDLCGLMHDLRTMPREQFDSTYPTGGTR